MKKKIISSKIPKPPRPMSREEVVRAALADPDAEPDQPPWAYLMLIARDPEHVDRTLNPKS